MPRAFNDMIVQEADGKPRLTFRSRQGTAVLEDVSVEVSSTVLQAGDAWGALAANVLLELDDDDVPVAVAPDFTPAATPAALTPRETMRSAFGKLAAAVSALTAHLADTVKHITSAERTRWNNTYTQSETDAKLAAKANASHTHDSRYYTETEMDTKLAAKANTSGTYDGLTAGDSARLGGKTLSMSMLGSDLEIWWQ